MRPVLVVGLGNPLAGDDGVASRVLDLFALRCPDHVETLWAGADLSRCADALHGRRHVVLVDAVAGGPPPGRVRVWQEPWGNLDDRGPHAHHLSPVQIVALLRVADPMLSATRFALFGIGVAQLESTALSPQVESRLPAITKELNELVAGL